MEHGLGVFEKLVADDKNYVLILVLMEHGLGANNISNENKNQVNVLILVLMEHGLGEGHHQSSVSRIVLILVLMEHGLGVSGQLP